MKKQKINFKQGDKIVAIDPGDKFTGIGSLGIDFKVPDPINKFYVRSAIEISHQDQNRAYKQLYDFLYREYPTYVVIEQWRLREDKKNDMVGSIFLAKELIGVIKGWLFLMGHKIDDNSTTVHMVEPHSKGTLKNPLAILERDIPFLNMKSEHVKDFYRLGRAWYLNNCGLLK